MENNVSGIRRVKSGAEVRSAEAKTINAEVGRRFIPTDCAIVYAQITGVKKVTELRAVVNELGGDWESFSNEVDRVFGLISDQKCGVEKALSVTAAFLRERLGRYGVRFAKMGWVNAWLVAQSRYYSSVSNALESSKAKFRLALCRALVMELLGARHCPAEQKAVLSAQSNYLKACEVQYGVRDGDKWKSGKRPVFVKLAEARTLYKLEPSAELEARIAELEAQSAKYNVADFKAKLDAANEAYKTALDGAPIDLQKTLQTLELGGDTEEIKRIILNYLTTISG